MSAIDADAREAMRESFARLLADRCTEADVRRTIAMDHAHGHGLARRLGVACSLGIWRHRWGRHGGRGHDGGSGCGTAARALLLKRDPRDRAFDGCDALAWRKRVHARGFAVPSWPHSLGGLGLTLGQSKLIQVEFAKVGAAGAGVDRTNIAANILLKCGTQAARAELLDRFVTAELPICLLYSEPGAGSDLAAVRTRADRNGDDYVISGQKIWTSGARDAAFGLLLARTDWNVPKHAGLSFFFLSMRQPGIDTRPIHQINGDSNFNEVFIDGTHVPARYLVSNEGDCWKVIHAALGYERLIMG